MTYLTDSMGLVSSIRQTQIDRDDRPSDELHGVAGPLKPAYAPNQAPSLIARPPTATSAWQQQSMPPIFLKNFPSRSFSGSLSVLDDEDRSRDIVPDTFSTAVPNSYIPSVPNSCKLFQPSVQRQESAKYANTCYSPLEMGSIQATGIILTRAARKLEATPPAYLRMPDHPNILPSSPPCYGSPQPPPNTSHGFRLGREVSSYPGVHKSHSNRDLVSGRNYRCNADQYGGPRPPSVG
ncbi:uncharacterized protein [Palaemon carinicauda]|uniref:uncharacterized protein n=1 Tax=Palaemon carinicauda TaxID=392227 RepID=UPI0035B59CA8